MVIHLKIENFTPYNSTTLSFIIFCHHLQLLPRKVNLLHLPQPAPFHRRRFPLLPLPRQSFFQIRTTTASTINVAPSFPVKEFECEKRYWCSDGVRYLVEPATIGGGVSYTEIIIFKYLVFPSAPDYLEKSRTLKCIQINRDGNITFFFLINPP